MSIHDIGSGDNRKNNVKPTSHDFLTQRKSDGTEGITYKVDSFTGGYVSTKDAQIYVNDGTTNRILIGRAPDGTYGMWIVDEGEEVNDLFINVTPGTAALVTTGYAPTVAVT
jgi:hypothetical protein